MKDNYILTPSMFDPSNRMEKPEPEWIEYSIKRPKKGQIILWMDKDESGVYYTEEYDPCDGWRVGEYGRTVNSFLWSDKATHDKALQEYESKRFRFPGWKQHKEMSYANEDLNITFYEPIGILIWSTESGIHLDVAHGIDLELFRKLFKMAKIELEEI